MNLKVKSFAISTQRIHRGGPVRRVDGRAALSNFPSRALRCRKGVCLFLDRIPNISVVDFLFYLMTLSISSNSPYFYYFPANYEDEVNILSGVRS